MSNHFTHEQISAALLGLLPASAREHLDGCAMCRSEVERVRNDFVLFGGAVREWASGMPVAVPRSAPQPRRLPFAKLALAGGLAAATLAAVWVSRIGVPRDQPRTDAKITDSALLQEVNTELSQSVPALLEPLANLADRNSSSPTRESTGRAAGGSSVP